MDSLVDPNADILWESVATTVSADGIEEKAPRTEEDWAEVRRSAIALIEAANLLLVPGRRVAKPGDKAEDPNIELAPEQIEEKINADWNLWVSRAQRLQKCAMESLAAIEEKNAERLLNAGGPLDSACESCHIVYWYPNDEAAKQLYEQREKEEEVLRQKGGLPAGCI